MEALNLQQGTAAWAEHRATALNASDAPAMMGYSPYRSRQDLIRERATGIVDADINPAQAKRFADGHRFEALARPLAEEIVGEELFPVVGKSGKYSASYDGLTLLEDTAFEHKTLGEALRYTPWDEGNGDHLPLHYRIQMEHQCMVCPTIERVLFMASRWADDGTLLEERHCWYAPDPALRARIVSGWEQFEADVAAYTPEPPKAAPVIAAPQETLPAVSVRVDGQLAIVSNLPAFGAALQSFIERIPAEPSTDQEFADTEAACKALKRAEEALEAAESNALAQLADVDTMRRLVADYRAMARTTRLQREKLVSIRKDELRRDIVNEGQAAVRSHTDALNKRLGGNYMPTLPVDFAGAIKGKKSLDSMRSAVNDELARAKIAANEIAVRIDINMGTMERLAGGYTGMFPDAAALVLKSPEDFELAVQARVDRRKAEEQARLNAERERIATEERAKAEAAAEADRARIRAEEQQKAQAEAAEREAAARRERILAEAAKPAVTRALEAIEREKDAAPGKPLAPAPTIAAPVAAGIAPVVAVGSASDDTPELTLGAINERLSPISLSAAGLAEFGIEPLATKKAAKLYSQSQFEQLCRAIVRCATDALRGEMEAA